MGLVISALRLIKPQYEFILKTCSEVHTADLYQRMLSFVSNCFGAIEPLASQYHSVCKTSLGYDKDDEICIGESVRIKHGWQKYGGITKTEDLFRIIRAHGEELKDHVRSTIKDEFAQLVDLTGKLIPYDDLTIKMEIPRTTIFDYDVSPWNHDVTITPIEVDAIGVETSYPRDLCLFTGGRKDMTINLTQEDNLSMIEDIVDYIVNLFKKAKETVGKVKDHNEQIMAQMDTIIAPYSISNSISKSLT